MTPTMAHRSPPRRRFAPMPQPDDLPLGVIGEGKLDRGAWAEPVDVVRIADPDGTIVVLHRVRDSLLDAMRASGWITEQQRDSGSDLKALWVRAGVNLAGGRGRNIALGHTGGDKCEVDNPRAFRAYQRAVRTVRLELRPVLVAVAIHDQWSDGYRLADVREALDQLGGRAHGKA